MVFISNEAQHLSYGLSPDIRFQEMCSFQIVYMMFAVFWNCRDFIFCDLTSKAVNIAVGLLLFTDLM